MSLVTCPLCSGVAEQVEETFTSIQVDAAGERIRIPCHSIKCVGCELECMLPAEELRIERAIRLQMTDEGLCAEYMRLFKKASSISNKNTFNSCINGLDHIYEILIERKADMSKIKV